MTINNYDAIIIGGGHNNLTPSLSPKRRGECAAQKQSPRFSQGLMVIDLRNRLDSDFFQDG